MNAWNKKIVIDVKITKNLADGIVYNNRHKNAGLVRSIKQSACSKSANVSDQE